jgi:hypothetical protein
LAVAAHGGYEQWTERSVKWVGTTLDRLFFSASSLSPAHVRVPRNDLVACRETNKVESIVFFVIN